MDAIRPCCASSASRRRPDLASVAAVCLLLLAALPAGAFESGRARFAVDVDGLIVPYRVFAIYVLPRETVSLRIAAGSPAEAYALTTPTGAHAARADGSWAWTAPAEAGLQRLQLSSATDTIALNVLVMRPRSDVVNGRVDGYRIGDYPTKPLNGNPLYLPPDGFVELDATLAELPISPHFKLGQFPAKQSTDYPKFLVLREQLLLKLELLLEHINANGIAADTLTVMSGYRTPFYNAAIGNVPYSRHVFGGAADIFIDVAPVDDNMDDLNGDGVSDYRDAQRLYRLADRLFSVEAHRRLRGGLGVYRRNSAHGPFLHVDAREQRARWGALP